LACAALYRSQSSGFAASNSRDQLLTVGSICGGGNCWITKRKEFSLLELHSLHGGLPITQENPSALPGPKICGNFASQFSALGSMAESETRLFP